MQTESAATVAPDAQLLGLLRGLSNEAYHKGPGLSNSGVKDLLLSPYHYHARHIAPRPEWFTEDPFDDTTGPKFAGTLCHCATLEPEAFEQRYIVGPDISKNSNAWKSFVAEHAPRQVISARQYAIAHAQADALRRLPAVAEILDGGECEISGYWIDPATGVLCRCRPDCANLTFGTKSSPAAMLLDVKTTTDASKEAVRRTIAAYGYHRQCEWYSRGMSIAARMPVAGFVFAFVESAHPFATRVVQIEPHSYAIAQRENRDALDLFAKCEREGQWPGYPQEVEWMSLPRWAGGIEP